MPDRITYNENEFTKYGMKTIDEVVLSDAFVHLEQLDDSYFMLIVENKKHHWHLRIGARGNRAKVDAWLFEGK